MPKSTETRKDDMKEEVSILSPTQVSFFALAIATVVKKSTEMVGIAHPGKKETTDIIRFTWNFYSGSMHFF